MSRSPVWPFVTLVVGFVLGALTVWALPGDAPTVSDDARRAAAPELASQRPSSDGGAAGKQGARSGPRDALVPRPAIRGAESDPVRAATDGPQTVGGSRRLAGGAGGPGADVDPGVDAGPVPPGGVRGATRPAIRPEASAAVAPVPSAAPLTVVVREAPGVVVDGATQLPIAGARVLLAVADGPRAGTWFGDTTDDQGRFHPKVGDDTDLRGARVELRVSKDGYEPSTTAVVGSDPVRIELRTRAAPPLPGRVVGVIPPGGDGVPAPTEIVVDGYDEHGGNASQFAAVDARGAFVLEGVPAGRWHFARGGGTPAAVDVPGGGEARVELAPPRPAGQGGFAVTDIDPTAVKPSDPARAARAAVLLALLRQLDPGASPALDDAARERLSLAVAQEVQRLDAEDRAALPRRTVSVTGLVARIEGGGRAWMRLEPKPRLFWRVEVTAGQAQFAAVPVGTYTAVLVQPGRDDQSCEVVVTPGAGVLVLVWGA